MFGQRVAAASALITVLAVSCSGGSVAQVPSYEKACADLSALSQTIADYEAIRQGRRRGTERPDV
jgi:hypothetical protein